MTAGLAAPTGRIVLFGATGYTGELLAEALVRRGLAPVLAGRRAEAVEALARRLEPLGEVAGCRTADVAVPATVAALVGEGDVLVTTVGPFSHYGEPALQAAVAVGAHYLDSTGEPAFIRQVFEDYGPPAAIVGSALLTAFGYDYVPGNLAAALALSDAVEAGHEPVAVEVGYFVRGVQGGSLLGMASGGTKASMAAAMLAPTHAWRDGRLELGRSAAHARAFDVAGRERQALSVGASEQLALPRQWPSLTDVEVYLGWSGAMTKPAQAGSAAVAAARSVPGLGGAVGRGISAAAAKIAPGSTGGPSAEERAGARTWAVAEVWAAGSRRGQGDPVARVAVEGPSPYDLTAELMAWAAGELAAGRVAGPGALGPAEAFGVDGLRDGCAAVGLARV